MVASGDRAGADESGDGPSPPLASTVPDVVKYWNAAAAADET